MKHLIKSNDKTLKLDQNEWVETPLLQIGEAGMEDLSELTRKTSQRTVTMEHTRALGLGHEHKVTINQPYLSKVVQFPRPPYEKVALGALYYNSVELVRPTRPWLDSVAFDGEYGNIPTFHGDMSKYSFGPATSEETVLYWHKFIEDDGTTLLVCDRNLVCSISWNHLNGAGFIFGKEIELDGQLYKCRVLTGGSTNRGSYYAGGQLPNEWDRYVMNGADIDFGQPIFEKAPLPVPEDYPSVSIETDQTAWARAHNQAWNWISMRSWCQEASGSTRVFRGNNSARYWYALTSSNSATSNGWRPVLERIQ